MSRLLYFCSNSEEIDVETSCEISFVIILHKKVIANNSAPMERKINLL